MEINNNPLICDTETGSCELPVNKEKITKNEVITSDVNRIKIVYFTDPICSSCWGVEPQLRKLKLEYGNYIDIEYRMGGLLVDWSYNSGGISSPSDVAKHWDEVSLHYNMPIDGDVWLEDPLHSSYPPSIAFMAAQLQDKQKAILFLRKIRENVFLEKKNITKWEHIEAAAKFVGLNVTLLKINYEGKAVDLFNDDLILAKKMGVRGFPSFFFVRTDNGYEILYGARSYEDFENKILKLYPGIKKKTYDTSVMNLFNMFKTLTPREFSELSGKTRKDVDVLLEDLYKNKKLDKLNTKNGSIFFKINE